MQTLRVNGYDMPYLEVGNGPPLVCVHGTLGDFRTWSVVEKLDFRDEEGLYREYRRRYPAEWGDRAPAGSAASAGFYNTMFMWPLLTFGWELFLETCLDARFARLMDEFAEINRRVFRVFARLQVNFIICHDDIVNTRGPTCSCF